VGVKDIKSVHVKGNVTPVDVNVNHLTFSTIQNIMRVWHVLIKDNILTL